MLKKIRLQILTERYEVSGDLYDDTQLPTTLPHVTPTIPGDVTRTEVTVAASYHDDNHRICIRYTEGAESGMEGTKTTVAFQKCTPDCVTVLRDGAVKSALQFERGQRYFGVYQTPIMPFELCLFSHSVSNGIEKTGILQLEYTIQLKGAQAEHNKLTLRIL